LFSALLHNLTGLPIYGLGSVLFQTLGLVGGLLLGLFEEIHLSRPECFLGCFLLLLGFLLDAIFEGIKIAPC